MPAAESSLNVSRGSLEKWIETRQLTSKIQSEWQSDREMLEQSVLMFERGLKVVSDQLATTSTNSSQVDRERLQSEASKIAASASLERGREFASTFEAEVKKIVPTLPEPLQEIVKPLLHRIPTDPHERLSPAERLQTLVGLLNELDKFDNAISVFNEKRRGPSGGRSRGGDSLCRFGRGLFREPGR